MRHTNLEEYRTSGTRRDIQAGAGFNTFNRGSYFRRAQLGIWCERALALLSLAFVLATLAHIVLRNLSP